MEKTGGNFSGINVLRDQYYMVRRLGGGGFGTVYMVQRKTNKDMFAAKHIKHSKQEELKYARNELEILNKMKESPVILDLEEYFESGLQSVILTEYLEGGELFERISSKEYALTEEKCRMFVQQVVSGIVFMHERSIIHLDLKPNNIVCVSRDDANLQVKIIDFGLARDIEGEKDVPISVVGTPEFMPPEVMKCTRASPLSDLWSLGVVVFMLITGGFSPFYSRNQYKMQRKILRGNYNIEHESFSGVSRQAKDLVRALLVVEPARRLTAKQCLDHSWLQAVNSGDSSSLSELRRLETQAMRRWLARRRWTRVCNAVVATLRLAARLPTSSQGSKPREDPDYFSSEQEIWLKGLLLSGSSETQGRWKVGLISSQEKAVDGPSRRKAASSARKPSREGINTRKASLQEGTARKESHEGPKQSVVRKASHDSTVRKASQDNLLTRASQDSIVRKASLESAGKKVSQEKILRKVLQEGQVKVSDNNKPKSAGFKQIRIPSSKTTFKH